MTRANLPERGVEHAEIVRDLAARAAREADFRGGKTWSLVYHAGAAHEELLAAAHRTFSAANALNPMAFRELRRLESEVVDMTAGILHAPPEAVGAMTSGGTESLLLVVKAARDRLRARRPWVRRPTVVLPRTAHVAFDKAAHYFGVKLVHVDVDEAGLPDVDAMARAVGDRTALVVASAPQYPHGVVDPVPAIGEIALANGVPLHVDACVGGFVLPFAERLGVALPTWDFRVPGVTSISADLHKYGYAAKGASVVVYRDPAMLESQFFVATDWPGGIYASPGISGTRPGGPIAAAWAAMHALGAEGYLAHTRDALSAASSLRNGIRGIDGLAVVGAPPATIFAWASREPAVNLYAVADLLEARGWTIDRQQRPASVHCTVTSNHVAIVDEYLDDVREAVRRARSEPGLAASGNAPMYGMMARVPMRTMVGRSVKKVLLAMHAPGAGAPDPAKLAGGGDGAIDRLLARHGAKVDRVLDGVERVRERARRTLRR